MDLKDSNCESHIDDNKLNTQSGESQKTPNPLTKQSTGYNLINLPPEILLRIFSLVSTSVRSFRQLSLTCKKLYKISWDASLNMRTLKVSPSSISYLYFPESLVSISLTQYEILDFESLFRVFPNVNALTLYFYLEPNSLLSYRVPFSKLVRFSLFIKPNVHNYELVPFNPKQQSLAPSINANAQLKLPKQDFTNIESITISADHIPSVFFEHKFAPQELQLNISHFFHHSMNQILNHNSFLSLFPSNLQKLIFLSTNDVNKTFCDIVFNRLTNLTDLSLKNCSRFDDSCIQTLSSPLITNLNLIGTTVSDSGFILFLSHWGTSLTTLKFSQLPGISDSTLLRLPICCPNLYSLFIQRGSLINVDVTLEIPRITDLGFVRLAQCPNLTILRVSELPDITKSGITDILDRRISLSSLEELFILQCPNINLNFKTLSLPFIHPTFQRLYFQSAPSSCKPSDPPGTRKTIITPLSKNITSGQGTSSQTNCIFDFIVL